MIQINLSSINWLRLVNYVIVGLVIVLFYQNCNDDNNNSVALNEISKHKATIENLKKEVKKLDYQKSKYKDTIAFLDEQNQKKTLEIAQLHEKAKHVLADVKQYNPTQIAKYYKERYKLPNAVKTTNLGTALLDTVAKLNISELIVGDVVKKELVATKIIVVNKDKIIVHKDSLILTAENQTKLMAEANKECEKASDIQGEVLKETEKSVRKEKTKKTVWQILTAGAVTYIGYLVLFK